MTRRPESVLAIDTGMATGWAFHDRAGMVTGTKVFPPSDFPGQTLANFSVWVADQIDEMKPEVVVFERPMANPKRPQGMELRFGMCGIIQLNAWRLERLCMPVGIATIKAAAGAKKKEQIIDAARAMGWRIATDHEADAAWMAHYAIQNINVQRGEAA